ncbi:MAG: ribosome recycling factor [Acholeplasmatales bacterium]|jgi:ribosome recycling factor|nr:ribosome recycling factor [Acholeplasmatales bacterium]
MNDYSDMIVLETEEKMQKTVESLNKEFNAVRTGRANPSLLDKIFINYYGTDTPLKQVSSINIVEGTQLYIKPFDKSILKLIEHAINTSDLGLPTNNDGVGLRIVLPSLTEDRRKQLVKEVDKISEFGKIAIRNIRRDANDKIKKVDDMSEDDEKGYLEDVQKLTDKFIKKIDDETAIKSQELLKQ